MVPPGAPAWVHVTLAVVAVEASDCGAGGVGAVRSAVSTTTMTAAMDVCPEAAVAVRVAL